jgi:hypothetical protein
LLVGNRFWRTQLARHCARTGGGARSSGRGHTPEDVSQTTIRSASDFQRCAPLSPPQPKSRTPQCSWQPFKHARRGKLRDRVLPKRSLQLLRRVVRHVRRRRVHWRAPTNFRAMMSSAPRRLRSPGRRHPVFEDVLRRILNEVLGTSRPVHAKAKGKGNSALTPAHFIILLRRKPIATSLVPKLAKLTARNNPYRTLF